MEVIDRYIAKEYNRPFYRAGFCVCKSYRIVKAARKLGHDAKLVLCISFPRYSALFGIPIITLHFYSLVDGVKVDVAFNLITERKRMKNADVKMTKGVIVPFI